jgi:putative endonuclease
MKQPRRYRRFFYVYILASFSGTLYVGLTDDLRKRVYEHKAGIVDGFTKRYQVNRLMYFETLRDKTFAKFREKQIKKFRREKKIALFEKTNRQWKDLSETKGFLAPLGM